ncbi:GmrSD restriction endonuclease domain-containing protein [Levyella massiliensis]|uniref:GmrSD restriction endonuclease domain-containing protein n=1 Tax=Levyella massiliensis TaxID=938289 RepID=UPI003EB88ECF
MQEIFSNTTLTVNQLIEKIDTGELGLPELQRPFIWKDAKVRDLFDSMMRGYPIGYLMLWECPALDKKKSIGVDAHSYDAPKEVIIDGQQRLTSLYAVMKGKKVINSKFNEKAIIISYCPLQDKFEVGYQATKKDPEWIYNISELFTTGNAFKYIGDFIQRLSDYRAMKGEVLTDDEQDVIADHINAVANLKTHTLPVFDINSNAEEEDVSEIFVRVNSGGVSLKQNDFILTLLSLYWDDGRHEIERFSKDSTAPAKGKTTSYNPLTTVTAQDVIRVVMAYAFDRARLKYGYKLLRGADFDKKGAVDEELRNQRFDTLKAKLPDVLDVHSWHEFIKAIMNAGYLSGDLILSGNAIFYSYAFYLIAKHRFNASYNENMHLTSLWFFYASLVSLYTGSFESTVENHLNSIKTLTTLDEYKNFILTRVGERLTNDYFDITLVGSEGLAVSGRGNNAWNAYVASLNMLNAKILFSKSNLLASKLFEPGTDGNRKSLEKHHLFPKAYLKSLGYKDSMINQMANYAFIDWKDNMDILDDAPSNYYPIVCQGRTEAEILEMEKENALPHGWENMTYEDFLKERRKLMAARIKEAFEQLKKNVG